MNGDRRPDAPIVGHTDAAAHALTELRDARAAGVHGSITWAAIWLGIAAVIVAVILS